MLPLGITPNFHFLSLNTHSGANQTPRKKSNYPENAIYEEAGHAQKYLEKKRDGWPVSTVPAIPAETPNISVKKHPLCPAQLNLQTTPATAAISLQLLERSPGQTTKLSLKASHRSEDNKLLFSTVKFGNVLLCDNRILTVEGLANIIRYKKQDEYT